VARQHSLVRNGLVADVSDRVATQLRECMKKRVLRKHRGVDFLVHLNNERPRHHLQQGHLALVDDASLEEARGPDRGPELAGKAHGNTLFFEECPHQKLLIQPVRVLAS